MKMEANTREYAANFVIAIHRALTMQLDLGGALQLQVVVDPGP